MPKDLFSLLGYFIRKKLVFLSEQSKKLTKLFDAFNSFLRIYYFNKPYSKSFPNHHYFTFAIIVPLINISKGSPANLSNSITDPSFSLSNSLIFSSALPTSTVSLTSIFSKTRRLSAEAGVLIFFIFYIS